MRVSRAPAVLIVAALMAAVPDLSRAQPPPSPPLARGTGLIVGQVVDAVTGKGIAGSIVTLGGSRRVLATASGQFAFTGLPAGSHALTASKSGYLDGAFGMHRPGGASVPIKLEDAERRGDIVIRLWRPASITGVVVDEAGEPLIGIQVTAVRRTTTGGRRRFASAGTTHTDDRGVYRLARLAPGDYVVGMMSSQVSVPHSVVRQYEESLAGSIGGVLDPSRTNLVSNLFQIGGTSVISGMDSRQVGDQSLAMNRNTPTPPPIAGTRVLVYPAVYWPSATAPAAATIVTVGPAQERGGVDLHVKPVPTARVSGTVASAGGAAAGLPVRLVAAGAEELGRPADVAGTLTDPSGAFTFAAVPAGDYALKIVQTPRMPESTAAPTTIQIGSGTVVSSSFAANPTLPAMPTEPTMWAALPITVADSEVAGVNLVLQPGIRVSGRVEFDGAAERPTPDQLARILVVVEPVDGVIDRVQNPPGRADAKGNFTTFGVPAGRYVVRVPLPPSGWTFKGAFRGDRDISESPLDLDSGDIGDVVLAFTDRPASLSGSVEMTPQLARDGVAVIVFPADAKGWVDVAPSSRRLRQVAVSDTGSFEIAALPAGAYYVAAIREAAAADWADPKILESLASAAAHVQIGDGEKATQTVRVQEIR
jgi:uncharacterized protein (DUF2141 family)